MSIPNTRYGAARIAEMLCGKSRIFFCGIGGISMSGLAHIAATSGYTVSGSDRTPSALTRRLENDGVTVAYGHAAENVRGADLFVYTVAIAPDNPELVEAKRLGVPCVSRADFLGFVMAPYTHRVGFAGSHGKSTATSMAAHIFTETGMDPTVVSGAEYVGMGGAYRLGADRDFLFESCEYMDNFLSFTPNLAVILNIEFDHGDYFADIDAVRASFRRYAELSLAAGGKVLTNGDDPSCAKALDGLPAVRFGLGADCDYRALDVRTEGGLPRFTLVCPDGARFAITLPVPGAHNVYNALAAFAALDLCGGDREKGAAALATFRGATRRMELKREINGAKLIEDYAHHPTEIRATIRAARAAFGATVRVLFQPHTYSRTAELFDGFAAALAEADEVGLLPIYSARETDTLGMSSEKLAAAIAACAGYAKNDGAPGEKKPVAAAIGEAMKAAKGSKEGSKEPEAPKAAKEPKVFADFADAAAYYRATLAANEVLLVMGAGDVNKVTALV